MILLRMKGEDSCLKDKLLDGGMRGKDNKGIGYREVSFLHPTTYLLSRNLHPSSSNCKK
jgi:hypothetical protein